MGALGVTSWRSAPRRSAGLATALVLLLAAPPAQASEASQIIEHCAKGQSLSGFSQNGYREALKQLPTELVEYSDCSSLISKAELAATGGGGGAGGSSNTPIPLTPVEQKAVEGAHRHGSAPVQVAGAPIRPGVVHANIASAVNTLPHSLFAVLAFLLACALVRVGEEARKRVRARRNG